MGNTESHSFPYTIGNQISGYNVYQTGWEMYDGVQNSSGTHVSIFTCNKETHENRVETSKNGLSMQRSVRFPSVQRYVDSIETATRIHIVTERVKPQYLPFFPEDDIKDSLFQLKSKSQGGASSLGSKLDSNMQVGRPLDSNSVDSIQMQISSGVYQIAQAQEFLNQSANIVHGNVNSGTIFINEEGDWKLGGFDLAFRVSNSNGGGLQSSVPSLIKTNSGIQPLQYQCAEIKNNRWKDLDVCPTHCIDIYALAVLIGHLYNSEVSGLKYVDTTKARLVSMPPGLQPIQRQIVHAASKDRVPYTALQSNHFFFTQFISMNKYILDMNLKSLEENTQFFKNQHTAYTTLPLCTVRCKLLPMLLMLTKERDVNQQQQASTSPNSRSTGTIASNACIPFTQIVSLLLTLAKYVYTTAEYKEVIVPLISRFFQSTERVLRVNLLQNIHEYSDSLDSVTVLQHIIPPLLLGLKDTHNMIRELTVKSLPLLQGCFDATTVNEKIVPALYGTLNDPVQSIRKATVDTQTHISASQPRKKQEQVLLTVHAKGLKDSDEQVRVQSIAGLTNSQDALSVEVCAKKVLPYISPYIVDTCEEVRVGTSRLIQLIVDKVEKNMRANRGVLVPEQQDAPEEPAPTKQSIGNVMLPVDTKVLGTAASTMVGSVSSWAASAVASAFGGKTVATATNKQHMGTDIGTAARKEPPVTNNTQEFYKQEPNNTKPVKNTDFNHVEFNADFISPQTKATYQNSHNATSTKQTKPRMSIDPVPTSNPSEDWGWGDMVTTTNTPKPTGTSHSNNSFDPFSMAPQQQPETNYNHLPTMSTSISADFDFGSNNTNSTTNQVSFDEWDDFLTK